MGSEWMLYRYNSGGNASTPTTRLKPAETKQWDLTTTDALGRTISHSSAPATSPGPRAPGHPMDATRGSISSASTAHSASDTASEPFILRHGRRYLRNVAYYPLPCDLPELQRQNLHTLLATSIFGRALGSTPSPQNPPKKVLEVACGSGYYSSVCHDYLSGLGYEDVRRLPLDSREYHDFGRSHHAPSYPLMDLFLAGSIHGSRHCAHSR